MNPKFDKKIINAARSYERARTAADLAGRAVCRLIQGNNPEEIDSARRAYGELRHNENKSHDLLARTIYGRYEYVQVDGVIYRSTSLESFQRILCKVVAHLTPLEKYYPDVKDQEIKNMLAVVSDSAEEKDDLLTADWLRIMAGVNPPEIKTE